MLVGFDPYLLFTNLPLHKAQRQRKLLWDQASRPGGESSQVLNFKVVSWAASDLSQLPVSEVSLHGIGQIEHKVAVGRIEADHDFFSRISTPDAVVLVVTTDADLARLAHFARPGERRQEVIHPLEVKERQFVLCTEGTSWLQ